MRQIFCWIYFLVFTSSLSGQWVRQHPFPELETINDIVLGDHGAGFAVGDQAVLFVTADDGDHWSWQEVPGIEWDFLDVEILEDQGQSIVLIGGKGLLKSTDGGESWEELESAPADVIDVCIAGPEVILVATTLGVYKSVDGGENWDNLDVPVVAIQDAHILNETHTWITTILPEEVWRTKDGGATWEKNTDVTRHDLVHFFSENTGLLLDNRDVYRSLDGGDSWELISDNGLQSNAFHIDFGSDSLHVFAALNGGRINYSTDGGVTWERVTLAGLLFGLPRSVHARNNEEVLFGGAFSSILKSPDQFQTIEETTAGPQRSVTDVDFISPGEGYAAGNFGVHLQTVDGGQNWIGFETEQRNFLAIDYVDHENIWAGSNQRILHSVDGGLTWAESLVLANSNIQGVKAVSDDVVIGISTSGIIYRTDDQGMNWDTVFIDPGDNSRLQDLEFSDTLTGYVSGFNGRLLKTTDGGISWNQLVPPVEGLQYEDLALLSPDECWLVSSSFVDRMWHSADGGVSWDTLQLPASEFWTGVHFISPDTGAIVHRGTGRGGVYLTFDGGQSWPAVQTTDFPYTGVTGQTGPNAGIWIYGSNGNIEALLNCPSLPAISNLMVEKITPCQGDTIRCQVQGTNIDTYQWSFPAGWDPVGHVDTSTVLVAANGSFGFISVQGINACGATSPLDQQVSTFVLPEPSIQVSSDTILEVDTEADGYQWYLDGLPIEEATMPFHIAGVNGNYACQLLFDIGCDVFTDTVEVSMVTTGIEVLPVGLINVMPLPVQDYCRIESQLEIKEIRISDIRGETLMRLPYSTGGLDLGHLPAGMYILVFATEHQQYVVKVPVVD